MTATNIKCSASASGALLAAWLVLTPMPLLAAPRDEVKDGVTRCDGIGDDRQWLDCFYGAAQPMRSHLGLPPAADAQQRLVPPLSSGPQALAPPTSSSARQEAGGFLSGLTGDQDADIRQRMTAYNFDQAGLFTVTLADGSVWRQLPTDGIRAGWRGPASGFVVRVSRGPLGATSLAITGTAVTYRVKRLK